MERIDKDDPGETFKISKPLSIFLGDFHGSPYSPRSGRLDRHAENVGKGGMDRANRGIGDLCIRIRARSHSIQCTALVNENSTGFEL